jgi:hypothetical protein
MTDWGDIDNPLDKAALAMCVNTGGSGSATASLGMGMSAPAGGAGGSAAPAPYAGAPSSSTSSSSSSSTSSSSSSASSSASATRPGADVANITSKLQETKVADGKEEEDYEKFDSKEAGLHGGQVRVLVSRLSASDRPRVV